MPRIYCEICNVKCKPAYENTCCSVACATIKKERRHFLKRVLDHYDETEKDGLAVEGRMQKLFMARGEMYERKANEALNTLIDQGVLNRVGGSIYMQGRLNSNSARPIGNAVFIRESTEQKDEGQDSGPLRQDQGQDVRPGMVGVYNAQEQLEWRLPVASKEKKVAESRLNVALAANQADVDPRLEKREKLLSLMDEFDEEEMELVFAYKTARTRYKAAQTEVVAAQRLLEEQKEKLEKASEELADLRTKLAERALDGNKKEEALAK